MAKGLPVELSGNGALHHNLWIGMGADALGYPISLGHGDLPCYTHCPNGWRYFRGRPYSVGSREGEMACRPHHKTSGACQGAKAVGRGPLFQAASAEDWSYALRELLRSFWHTIGKPILEVGLLKRHSRNRVEGQPLS